MRWLSKNSVVLQGTPQWQECISTSPLLSIGVRFIAINDNFDTIDPNSVDNDFAGIKNWFGEFYARDTSRKIRAVSKAKGERGERLTTNVPYGYAKDPEDKSRWLVKKLR